jgi:Rap1a immunity proteins
MTAMKIPLLLTVLVLLSVLKAEPVFAQSMTGLDLRDQCQAVGQDVSSMSGLQGLKAMSCLGFTQGVVEGWVLAGRQVCLPDNVTVAEEGLVVSKYLDKHPEQLHLEPAQLIIKAMQSSWPCK